MARKKKKNRWYAWRTARGRGIVRTWAECEAIVSGKQALYRGFPDRSSAEEWLRTGKTDAAGSSKPPRWYAWRTESDEGVVASWSECEARVSGRRARYRSFPDPEEARAWLDAGAPWEAKGEEKRRALMRYPAESVFFDAGTGAGRGVQIRVTDRDEVPLLHLAPHTEGELLPDGGLLVGHGRTNNYGELLACHMALHVAMELGWSHVWGDSKLVLDYWSLGRVSRDKRAADPDLAGLAKRCAVVRGRFEAGGGSLGHVPGGINPADLGYHRD